MIDKKLNFVLVTRHLNRSGYQCLNSLLKAGLVPRAIIVSSKKPSLSSLWLRPFIIGLYKLKCWFYRCEELRMLNSEECLAKKNRVPIIRIPSFKTSNAHKVIKTLNLDLIVVAGGWHEKIPINVIKCPRFGSINIHPSLLPKFRGTSITRWQVYEGVNKSGVTIHLMDEKFDNGNVIAQYQIDLNAKITPQALFQSISKKSSSLLVNVLNAKQKNSESDRKHIDFLDDKSNIIYNRYYPNWRWDSIHLSIKLNQKFSKINALILAATQESYEYPGPELNLNGKNFIVRKASITNKTMQTERLKKMKEVLVCENQYIRWERPEESKALLIEQIQPAGPFFYLYRANKPGHWFKSDEHIQLRPLTYKK